jgi:hypothetical protein
VASIIIHAETAPGSPLGKTMNQIRRWLDSERIEPTGFKTVVGRAGLGFEIRFKSEWAERFQQQFPSLVECTH